MMSSNERLAYYDESWNLTLFMFSLSGGQNNFLNAQKIIWEKEIIIKKKIAR